MTTSKIISGIYQIENKINGKIYIGSAKNIAKRWRQHKSDLKNKKHHCIYLQRAWNVYGKKNFMFKIIETIDNQKILLEREQWYLDNIKNKYNIGKKACGGDNISNHILNKEISKQISNTIKSNRSKMTSEERNIKFGRHGKYNGMYGKKHTNKTRKLMSKKKLGKPLLKARHAKKWSLEGIKKLQQLAKSRIKEKNPFYGKHHSEEYKQKSQKRILKKYREMTIQDRINNKQIKFVEIDGIIYEGVSVAARKLNCTPANIIYKLKSNKYPNYKYVDKTVILV